MHHEINRLGRVVKELYIEGEIEVTKNCKPAREQPKVSANTKETQTQTTKNVGMEPPTLSGPNAKRIRETSDDTSWNTVSPRKKKRKPAGLQSRDSADPINQNPSLPKNVSAGESQN